MNEFSLPVRDGSVLSLQKLITVNPSLASMYTAPEQSGDQHPQVLTLGTAATTLRRINTGLQN
jgi:hypothetical protein